MNLIVTYTTDDSAAPPHMRACAALLPSGRKTPNWVAHGHSPEEAAGKLQEFLRKEEERAANIAQRRPRKAPPEHDDSIVI